VLVGVNEYVEEAGQMDVEILRIDPQTERDQVARLRRFKDQRDHELVARRLQDLREVAHGTGNLLYPIKDALRDRATIGEVCNVMREVFGEYKPPV
jgi:methylmalonyl-CoA mutase N-terminal domain/subunit